MRRPGAMPVTAEAVRFGAQSGRGQRCPLPSSCENRCQLAMSADLDRKLGLSKSGFSHGANWKVLGGKRRPGRSWGGSPLQALGFTVNLVHSWPIQGCSPQRESQRRACGDTKGSVWSCALTSACPIPSTQTQGPP